MSGATEGPYWKRAHRDWRVRTVGVVMLLAMIVFVLTENLAGRTGVQHTPSASPAAK